MTRFKTIEMPFLHADASYKKADLVIFGAPLDATTSFRPGTRFGPNAIRLDSQGLEGYSPYRNDNLNNYLTCDIGDLSLPMGDVETALAMISEQAKTIIHEDKKVLMLGGEHLVTLPVVEVLSQKYPNLHIIQFDAHTDLRDSFLGRKLSHATVIRRCYDILGDNKIHQFGIRSGDESEFAWAAKGHTELTKFDFQGLSDTVARLKDVPVYITIDLDVLDPSIMPGTGTPEPGGVTYKELLAAIDTLSGLQHIVGADIVELSPHYDHSGVATVAAAKTVREMILLLQKRDK